MLETYGSVPRPRKRKDQWVVSMLAGLIAVGFTIFVIVGLWGLEMQYRRDQGKAWTIEQLEQLARESDGDRW